MDNVQNALQKAKAEIIKLKLGNKNVTEYKQNQAQAIIKQSTLMADRVLKQLIAHTVGESIDCLFEECLETTGQIHIEKSSDNKSEKTRYIMQLGLVDKKYMLNMKELVNDDSVKQRLAFLLNMVKVLYCALKNHMLIWASNNNTSFDYNLNIAENTTLYLDEGKSKRIGVLLKKVDVFPGEILS
jgi:hypothetical protein